MVSIRSAGNMWLQVKPIDNLPQASGDTQEVLIDSAAIVFVKTLPIDSQDQDFIRYLPK